MQPANQFEWKKQLSSHLRGGEAFKPLEVLLEEVSFEMVGKRPYSLPYSIYELVYHIAYAQRDILKFCVETDYNDPIWPEDYWPVSKEPASKTDWDTLKQTYFEERQRFDELLHQRNLLESVPTNTKKTYLRAALLVIEHTAYHTGQLAVLLRLLNELDE
jgi:uncharacterized damage-inducible protein DinB